MLRTQSDARLVDLVRAGHASAFEAIVQRYHRALLAYCSRLLPASRAEDAVQQTFLKAYQAMVSGDADLNLRPWLYRIAHNASLNLLRQNGWSHEELDENMDGVQRPDQALELRERLSATVAAVNALPARQRDAVLLRELDGLSYDEIALALGVGGGAVRQLLHRARATLRAGMTAVTPVGMLERVASALAGTSGDPSVRVAELAAGAGIGAGAAKLSAAVIATGVIATGAVAVPLVKHSRHAGSGAVEAAQAAPVKMAAADPAPGAHATPVDDNSGSGATRRRSTSHSERHRSGSGSKRGSSGKHGSSLRSGSGDGSRPLDERRGSSGGGEDHHSGSGTGSGSGSGDRPSGSGTGSGSGGGSGSLSDGGGDHSGSGGGGSDDPITTPTGTTGPTDPVIEPSGDGSGSGSGTGTSSGSSDGSSSTSSGSLGGD